MPPSPSVETIRNRPAIMLPRDDGDAVLMARTGLVGSSCAGCRRGHEHTPSGGMQKHTPTSRAFRPTRKRSTGKKVSGIFRYKAAEGPFQPKNPCSPFHPRLSVWRFAQCDTSFCQSRLHTVREMRHPKSLAHRPEPCASIPWLLPIRLHRHARLT